MATKILIVDDRGSLSHFIAMELQTAGYQTSVSCTAAAEPRRFREASPDLVILNWDIRRTCASELCTQLKAGNDRLPIIAITANDECGCYLTKDVQTCLIKPFSMPDLLAAIERQLAHRQQRQPAMTA